MKQSHIRLCLLLFITSVSFTQAQESTKSEPSSKRLWSMSEVFEETQRKPAKRVRYCNGGRVKPCVCWSDVARDMRYRPALEECGGKAAVILSGKYLSIFSAVVRDGDNSDRWPASGFNGCSASVSSSENPPAYCSAFKAQEKISVETTSGKSAQVHCLGASGYSSLFKKVSRVTIKLADKPGSSDDPLVRWCLRSPSQPLN